MSGWKRVLTGLFIEDLKLFSKELKKADRNTDYSEVIIARCIQNGVYALTAKHKGLIKKLSPST
jgi:hypothetical protein